LNASSAIVERFTPERLPATKTALPAIANLSTRRHRTCQRESARPPIFDKSGAIGATLFSGMSHKTVRRTECSRSFSPTYFLITHSAYSRRRLRRYFSPEPPATSRRQCRPQRRCFPRYSDTLAPDKVYKYHAAGALIPRLITRGILMILDGFIYCLSPFVLSLSTGADIPASIE